MKNFKLKLLSTMLIAVMCFGGSSMSIFAEDIVAPDNQQLTSVTDTVASSVTQSEYSLAGKYISFTWNKVEDSSGKAILYALRMWKNSSTYKDDNKVISVTDLEENKYSSKKGLLKNNTYRYQVVAYHKGEDPVWTDANIQTIDFNASVEIPLPTEAITAKFAYSAKAKNTKKLGEIVQKDNTVSVKWTVKDPTLYSHFDIHRINSSGTDKLLASVDATDKTSYTYKDYSPGGTFEYQLYLFSSAENCKCVYTATDKVTGPNVPKKYIQSNKITTNHSWNALALKKLTLYKTPGGDKYTTVPKDTLIPATGGYSPEDFDFWETPTWVELKYNGKTCWAKWSQVKMKWKLTYNDYAWSVKEAYVKSEKFKSNTDYLIWVSRYTNRTNVFHKEDGKWVLKKVYDCNTGNYYQPLKGGQYTLAGKERIKYKIHRNGREYYFEYSRKFGGSGTFHTRCRWSDTGNLRNAIKRHPTTKGCCRLYDAAAKYIYNLPKGTRVVIR